MRMVFEKLFSISPSFSFLLLESSVSSLLLSLSLLSCLTPLVTSGPPLAPETTFSVFWNAPSESCQRKGIKLDLDKFKIKHNQNLEFQGSVITLFYAHNNRFGLFPYIDHQGKEVNGGIPQRVDLKRHLSLVKQHINKALKEDFDGLAVIDWEIWRPIFDRNWGKMRIYQKKSVNHVKKRFPALSAKAAMAKAREEWNFSAKQLLLDTLQLARNLRPKAQWGFYKFPECYNYKTVNPRCDNTVEVYNNELNWMWNASTALFPSAYFSLHSPKTFVQKKNLVQGHITESFRVGKMAQQQSPVYFYMKYSYSSTSFASREDLEATVQLASNLGAAGVILWDASLPFRDHAYCSRLRDNLEKLLGPFAKRVIDEARDCATSRCGARGRCVIADKDVYAAATDILPSQVHSYAFAEDGFQCKCFRGRKGDRCEIKA